MNETDNKEFKLENNKFFVRNLSSRVYSYDTHFIINDLKECLKSEGVDLSIENIVKFLDIFMRVLYNEIRLIPYKKDTKSESVNLLKEMYIWSGGIKINSIKNKDLVLDRICTVNNLCQNKIDEDSIKIIKDNFDIVLKEYIIFINELFESMKYIYNDLNKNKNIFSYAISIPSKFDEYNMSIMYTMPPKEVPIMFYIIRSNIVSGKVLQTSINIVRDTFPKDCEKLDKLLELNDKN